MTASMSLGFNPALFIAISAAFSPKSLANSPSAAIRLSLMPVRLVIHSSLVSTSLSKSALLKMRLGAKAAMLFNEAFGLEFSHGELFLKSQTPLNLEFLLCKFGKLAFYDLIYAGFAEFQGLKDGVFDSPSIAFAV